jgi:hypothetical protein
MKYRDSLIKVQAISLPVRIRFVCDNCSFVKLDFKHF